MKRRERSNVRDLPGDEEESGSSTGGAKRSSLAASKAVDAFVAIAKTRMKAVMRKREEEIMFELRLFGCWCNERSWFWSWNQFCEMCIMPSEKKFWSFCSEAVSRSVSYDETIRCQLSRVNPFRTSFPGLS